MTAADIKPGTAANCNCWATVIGIDKGRKFSLRRIDQPDTNYTSPYLRRCH
jgi:hypothetical protein